MTSASATHHATLNIIFMSSVEFTCGYGVVGSGAPTNAASSVYLLRGYYTCVTNGAQNRGGNQSIDRAFKHSPE